MAEKIWKKKAKDNFTNFNNSNLNDKLLGIDYYAKGVKIIFKNNKYVFYPHTSNLNHNSISMQLQKSVTVFIKNHSKKI